MPKKIANTSNEITVEYIGADNSKKILVNKKGDYITLNFNDATLINRYISLCAEYKKAIDEINKIRNKISENPDMEAQDIIKNTDDINIITIQISERFDSFFQDDSACEKVFGTKIPYPEEALLYLRQMEPMIEKFMGEKADSLTKNIDKFLSKQSARGKLI